MTRPSTSRKDMRFIVRMEGSYRVHVQYGAFAGSQDYFSFVQYGGEQKALAAAKRHRNALLKKHKVPARDYTGNGWYAKAKESNWSGVAGINLSVNRANTPYAQVNWTSYYMDKGVQKRISRGIAKHGYSGAWALVASRRREHTGQPIPEAPPPAPEWLLRWATEREIELK